MYHVTCVCGANIITPIKTGTCAACGRGYTLVWPAPLMAGPKVVEKTISEKYED